MIDTSSTALMTLMEASRALAESESLEEALKVLVWHAATTLGVPECIVYEYDPSLEVIIPLATYERAPTGWDGLGKGLSLAEFVAEKAVLESGRPLLERISDPDLAPASRASMEQWGEKTCLTIPLLVGSDRLGLMAFYDTERERDFSETNLALAHGLAALSAQALHSAQLVRQADERNARLNSLLHAGRAVNSGLDLDEVLETIADQAMSALGCDGCTMQRSADGAVASSIGIDSAATVKLEDTGEGYRLVVPLLFGNSRLGTMSISRPNSGRTFSLADIEFARGLAEHAGLAIHSHSHYEELRQVQVAGLRTLANALGAKDWYMQGHGARVAHYLALLGVRLGWGEEMIERAEEVGYLHDIGKLIVSDGILQKTGPLTEREWAMMCAHPETGAGILQGLADKEQVGAILSHHERFDGEGYPRGLAGKDIPPMGRALCVVDAYDAMSSPRPYRRALSYEECRAELKAGRGSQFDPEMLDALLKVLEDIDGRKKEYQSIAEKAAALVDPDKHGLLRTRKDEERPEYAEIAGLLRGVLRESKEIRFLTTQRAVGSQAVIVVDAEESEEFLSHIGDEVFAIDDEMREVLAGLTVQRNVLYADEFGVWVRALAPLRDGEGNIIGVAAADSPPLLLSANGGGGGGGASKASQFGRMMKRTDRAKFQTTTDALTGLHNLRYLSEHITGKILEAIAEHSEFVLMFIDIDDFSTFNHSWGFALGDEALRVMAYALESHIRSNDVVARYAGEEFVVVLSDCSLKHGLEVADAIRSGVAKAPLVVGTEVLSVSIGVAHFPTHGASRAKLIEGAEAAMREARGGGGDKVGICV